MSYVKQTWADDDPSKPLSAARMNHIEDGIEAVEAGGQPASAVLDALAALSPANNKLAYFTGPGTADLADLSAFIRTLIGQADAAAARATLGIDEQAASGYVDVGTIRIAWGALSGKNGDTLVVSFPGGGFGAAPTIIPTATRDSAGALGFLVVESPSATQFTARFVNTANSTLGGTNGNGIAWLAFGTAT